MKSGKPSRLSVHAPRAASEARLFRGWLVVGGAFAVTLIGFGSAYTFSAFAGSLEHDFHASRGSVSLVFSLAGFMYFVFGIVSGPLADRFGSKALAFIGMLVTGAGLMVAASATTLNGVYAAYVLGIGLGVGLSYVPAVAAVQRWFVRSRGLASGLAVSGIGAGTLILPPLATWLIHSFGWRQAYCSLGLLAVIGGGSLSLLIASDPADFGLGPDGDPLQHPALPRSEGVAIADAVRSARFAGLYIACLFGSIGLFVPFVHLVPYAEEHGVASSAAVFLVGLIGVGSTAGRFVLGGLADRMGRLLAVMLMFIGIAGSMLLWAFSSGVWGLGLFGLIFGLFYGGLVALLPAVVMDDFGGLNVSGLIGILYTSVAFGTLIGPSLAGFAFDLSHSYTLPILGSAVTSVLAAVIIAATNCARQPASDD